jgi:acyl carrier protein
MNNLLCEADTEVVIKILLEQLDVARDQISSETKLNDLGRDSLIMVEIVMALEDRFEITIPDERVEKVETVGDIFELLAELLSARAR